MKRVLKWIGSVLGGLVALILLVAVIGYVRGSSIVNKEYEVQPASIPIPSDEKAIARGEYLVSVWLGCQDCHGENLGGQEFINEPGFAALYAPNLTSGNGGAAASYSDEDWIRALRHGIRPDGTNLIIMPSEFYTRLSAEELGVVVAYVRSLPPVDNETPDREVFTPPRLLLGLGMLPPNFIPAEVIDHDAPPPAMPEVGANVAYGDYRANTCRSCHGEELAGVPADPQAGLPIDTPNLTPGGDLGGWTEEQFLTAVTTGVTPDGRQLNPELMPWPGFANASEEDLRAIWLFLQSLPASESNAG
ncbi:MAG: cytochrome c [Chloroflexi bacterium]|nr:cytochrome c [Chloroflexota bacterium]MCI0574840.1 cytochrome c [Chloroflexota bacterium]MCI0645942.1 cytochrome c [Chloroflexota bacterium]MCI0727615.1 cytochrome c [Chloroflexota bacterium]